MISSPGRMKLFSGIPFISSWENIFYFCNIQLFWQNTRDTSHFPFFQIFYCYFCFSDNMRKKFKMRSLFLLFNDTRQLNFIVCQCFATAWIFDLLWTYWKFVALFEFLLCRLLLVTIKNFLDLWMLLLF